MAKHSGEKFQASWLLILLLYPNQNIYIVQLFSLQKQNKIIKASILKTVNFREMIDSLGWELFKFIVARHDEVLTLNTTTHPIQGGGFLFLLNCFVAAVILCCWIKKTPERQILPGHWLIWKDSIGNHRCIVSYRSLPSSSKVSCPENSLSSWICFPCVQTAQFSLACIHVKELGYGEKVAV